MTPLREHADSLAYHDFVAHAGTAATIFDDHRATTFAALSRYSVGHGSTFLNGLMRTRAAI